MLQRLQSNQGVPTKKPPLREIPTGAEKGIVPLQKQMQYLVQLLQQHDSRCKRHTWLQPHKSLPLAHSPFLGNTPPTPKPLKADHPAGRNCVRHTAKKPSPDLLKGIHVTSGDSEKSLSLTTPSQPLGFHSLPTKQAELG